MTSFRVYSWNINGLRSAQKKGFLTWLQGQEGVVGLQETRADEDQLDEEIRQPDGWITAFVAAERKGYSGVGLYSRFVWDEVLRSVGIERFDSEGRVLVAKFGEFEVWNVYFPNGSGKNRDLSRIPYKLDFYDHLLAMLKKRVETDRILVMGDFNTAYQEIDLARPKANVNTSGFREEERECLGKWFEAGFIDTFRALHGDVEHRYTWWSQRYGVRTKNIGWRIDYVLASPAAFEYVLEAEIHHDVMGSDHCPVSVLMSDEVLGEAFLKRQVSNS